MKTTLAPLALALLGPIAHAHPCADITMPEQRLACYDRAFPPRSAAPVAAAPPASKLAPAQQRFGLPVERAPTPELPAAITAALLKVEYRPDGARLFTLDNGQRWLETDSQRRGVTAEGDHIQIKRASFGSFLLVTPARVGIRVRRLP